MLVWRQLQHATWKTFQAEFRTTLDKLVQHKQHVQEQAAILSVQDHRLSREAITAEMHVTRSLMTDAHARIQDSFVACKAAWKTAQDTLYSLQEKETHHAFKELLSWLDPADMEACHDDIKEPRKDFPDAGSWLIRNSIFLDWECQDPAHCINPLLWLEGIPGAGRSSSPSIVSSSGSEETCRTLRMTTEVLILN